MIRHSSLRHQVLARVASHSVIWHSGYSAHPQGYGWRDGGDPSEPIALALLELEGHRLICLLPGCVCGGLGCEVALTAEGRKQLSMWDEMKVAA